MDSPTGIIPESLMYRSKRVEVRQWLINYPAPGYIKRDWFFAWARTVAVRLNAREVAAVAGSGTDPDRRE